MTILYLLIPLSLFMGLVGLTAFLWSLKNGQYEDLLGAAERILYDADEPPPQSALDAVRGNEGTKR